MLRSEKFEKGKLGKKLGSKYRKTQECLERKAFEDTRMRPTALEGKLGQKSFTSFTFLNQIV